MSLNSYTNFRTACYTWLDIATSDVTTTAMNDIIKAGELRVQRDLRIRQMERSFTRTMIADGTITVPADHLELKSAYIDGSPTVKLERVTVENIYDNYPTRSSQDKPRHMAREGNYWIFGPYPDSTYVVKGVEYAQPTAMADTEVLNSIFTQVADVYLFAALLESEPFIGRDSRYEIWERKYLTAINACNAQDNRERHSGSSMSVKVG